MICSVFGFVFYVLFSQSVLRRCPCMSLFRVSAVYLNIHVYGCVWHSLCLPIYLNRSLSPSVCFWLFVSLYACLSFCVSIGRSVSRYFLVRPSMRPFLHSSVRPYVCPSVPLPIRSSVHMPICPALSQPLYLALYRRHLTLTYETGSRTFFTFWITRGIVGHWTAGIFQDSV